MRPLLILACPRSGTKYIFRLLRALGMKAWHERLPPGGADDSVVGWRYAALSRSWCVHLREECPNPGSFGRVIHQVRHPLRVLATLPTIGDWDWIRSVLPDLPSMTDLRLYAEFWLQWNALCAEQAEWTYCVEDLRPGTETMRRMLGVVGLPADTPIPAIPTDVNTRRHSPRFADAIHQPTWGELVGLDKRLAARVRERAREYGYVE